MQVLDSWNHLKDAAQDREKISFFFNLDEFHPSITLSETSRIFILFLDDFGTIIFYLCHVFCLFASQ